MSDKVYIKMFVDIFENKDMGAKGFIEFLIFFMFFYGCYCFLCKVMRFFGMIWVHLIRDCMTSKDKLFTKYGQAGSYALVTGGSDGIGLQMCVNLADQGFNIMMVARNEEKMQQKIEEIKANCKNKNVECKYIVADFGKLQTMADYREKFEFPTNDLDIGVVIANAGYGEPGLIKDLTDDYYEMSMNLNVLHVYYIFKIMSEKLLKREKRSAMIVTSSIAYIRPFPVSVVYSCQKKFVTFLAQGMHMELGDKIEIMSYNPAEVTTKLIHKDESQAGGPTITPEKAVSCCFRDLGHTDVSHGAFWHDFSGWMFALTPDWMMAGAIADLNKEKIKEAVDKQEKEYQEAKAKKGEKPNAVAPNDTAA